MKSQNGRIRGVVVRWPGAYKFLSLFLFLFCSAHAILRSPRNLGLVLWRTKILDPLERTLDERMDYTILIANEGTHASSRVLELEPLDDH